jgi:hypothetical protein
MERIMFTGRQLGLIKQCQANGYGWKLFADSVEKQGWCSLKQEDTLCLMTQKISLAKAVKAGHFRNGNTHPGYSNISDNEAARGHDFF